MVNVFRIFFISFFVFHSLSAPHKKPPVGSDWCKKKKTLHGLQTTSTVRRKDSGPEPTDFAPTSLLRWIICHLSAYTIGAVRVNSVSDILRPFENAGQASSAVIMPTAVGVYPWTSGTQPFKRRDSRNYVWKLIVTHAVLWDTGVNRFQ